jgi:hypothetical protein
MLDMACMFRQTPPRVAQEDQERDNALMCHTRILTRLIPLRTRALYDTWLSAVYAVASISAPLIGSKLTSKVSWRWCFWVNLPCGAVSAVAIVAFIKVGQGHTLTDLTWRSKLKAFDAPGAVMLMAATTCLLLALQWGGVVYAWDSGVIVALFAVFAALSLVLLPMQWRAGDAALVPTSMLRMRSISTTTIYHVLLGGAITIFEYYVRTACRLMDSADE